MLDLKHYKSTFISAVLVTLSLPFLLRYWWAQPLAFAVMLFIFQGCRARSRLNHLAGINMPQFSMRDATMAFVVLALLFTFTQKAVASYWGMTPQALSPAATIQNWVWIIFSAINQEIMFRALLLRKGARYLSKPTVSVLAATLFALVHWPFCYFVNGIWLSPVAIVTMALFGLGLNTLFWRQKHIGMCAAIHAAWNGPKMANTWKSASTGNIIHMSEAFNYFEGSYAILMMTMVITGAILIWSVQSRKLMPSNVLQF